MARSKIKVRRMRHRRVIKARRRKDARKLAAKTKPKPKS
jgi:hypothetical protein